MLHNINHIYQSPKLSSAIKLIGNGLVFFFQLKAFCDLFDCSYQKKKKTFMYYYTKWHLTVIHFGSQYQGFYVTDYKVTWVAETSVV